MLRNTDSDKTGSPILATWHQSKTSFLRDTINDIAIASSKQKLRNGWRINGLGEKVVRADDLTFPKEWRIFLSNEGKKKIWAPNAD